MLKLSIKALKELHDNLGGNEAGFHITAFGHDIKTGEAITTDREIAYAMKSQANWSYRLIKAWKK
jgi:hypothetical protein